MYVFHLAFWLIFYLLPCFSFFYYFILKYKFILCVCLILVVHKENLAIRCVIYIYKCYMTLSLLYCLYHSKRKSTFESLLLQLWLKRRKKPLLKCEELFFTHRGFQWLCLIFYIITDIMVKLFWFKGRRKMKWG